MGRMSLNGYWDWRLTGGPARKMPVPSSYPCVGEAFFETVFDCPAGPDERAFLCFEGVAYTARVALNGEPLGDMLPYAPYRFEITDRARPEGNRLGVAVKDITAGFGPTNGWEDYGGIVRDVFLEVRPRLLVEDIQWISRLDGAAAVCAVEASVSGPEPLVRDAEVSTTLSRRGAVVASSTQRAVDGKALFSFTLGRPELWAPESPALYDLAVSVSSAAGRDTVERKVGIREFRVEGARFLLNGAPVVLKGVARHDLWGDAGFTLTPEQVEEDLALVKRMGANFIRLVHYPHSRQTIETADRLGLMVTEEPGLWWSDMEDASVTGAALEILRRTVLRDRNSPSVVAWLFFNECVLEHAQEYLEKGRDLCRGLDPTRPVSGANCMDSAEAKDVFDRCGLDFYTQHPYSYEPAAMEKAAGILRGKPLVFTEWGGWYIHENPNLLPWFTRTITRLTHAQDGEPAIAGLCWWQWQDIFQFSRGMPGCMDGLLSDGLVDRFRNRKPTYFWMQELFDAIDAPEPDRVVVSRVGEHAPIAPGASLRALDLSSITESAAQREAWERALAAPRRHPRTPVREGVGLGGPFLTRETLAADGLPVILRPGRPVILTEEQPRVSIPVGAAAVGLHLIGGVTFFDGWPVRGTHGEPVARYVLVYREGAPTEVPLRNGIETASASLLARSSRMNPVANAAPRMLEIQTDADWELYQVNRLPVAADAARLLERVDFELLNPAYMPLLYAVAVETLP
jgi:hypothetical protein